MTPILVRGPKERSTGLRVANDGPKRTSIDFCVVLTERIYMKRICFSIGLFAVLRLGDVGGVFGGCWWSHGISSKMSQILAADFSGWSPAYILVHQS